MVLWTIWDAIVKVVNPLWVHGGSHSQMIFAFFVSLYPSVNEKVLSGLFFYVSIISLYVMYFFHGFLFNFYSDPPAWCKYFSYHPNLPILFKIFKFMITCAVVEILFPRFYVFYLHLKRPKKLKKLLELESQADEQFRQVLMKWTELFCLTNSFLGVIVCPLTLMYGMDESDDFGKVISLILTLVTLPASRLAPCDLYVIYSYVILLIHIFLKLSTQMVAITYDFLTSGHMSDHSVSSVRIRYYLIVKMIDEAEVLVSFVAATANSMAVPIMALAWVLFFEKAESIFLLAFKWFLFTTAFYYSSRVYLMNAYLSKVHSESKKLYANLNSLIAREQVSLLGKRKLLFIIENISGRANQMAFHDTLGTLVEQIDVLKSIFATLELLLLGFAFKNNMSL